MNWIALGITIGTIIVGTAVLVYLSIPIYPAAFVVGLCAVYGGLVGVIVGGS